MPIVNALSETFQEDLQELLGELEETLPDGNWNAFHSTFEERGLRSASQYLTRFYRNLGGMTVEQQSRLRRQLGKEQFNALIHQRIDTFDKLQAIMSRWRRLMHTNGGAYRADQLRIRDLQMAPASQTTPNHAAAAAS